MKTAARKRAEKRKMLWVRTYETEDALVITIRAAKRKLFDRFRQVLCAVVLIFCTGKLTACANPRRNRRRHFPPLSLM